jgi:hypothetical protein
MSRPWGHTLTPFTVDETARRDSGAIRQYRDDPERAALGYDVEGRRLCSALSSCRNPAAWWATCRYGPTEVLCEDHAARWCSRHAAVVRVLVADEEGS